jgi:hypothetical protein
MPAGAALPPVAAPAYLPPLSSPAPLATPAAALPPLAAPPEPVAQPSRAQPSRTLPPLPLQPLPRLTINVPNTLPPPIIGGGAPTVPQPVSTEPPTTFWQTPRN